MEVRQVEVMMRWTERENGPCRERTGRGLSWPRIVRLFVLGAVLTGASGCARVLTITQEDYINTAMHIGRPKEQRTGQPLELSIVCVHAADLQKEANDLLSPESEITSKIWYENRPEHGDKMDDEAYAGFQLPKNQVFLLTDDKKCFGKRLGARLRGAKIDNRDKVVVRFNFAGGLHSDTSVIYVFPKFIGPKGEVLPVRPAVFHPPGAYTNELSCKIGVDESREDYGQYIENTTPRKMHGSEENE